MIKPKIVYLKDKDRAFRTSPFLPEGGLEAYEEGFSAGYAKALNHVYAFATSRVKDKCSMTTYLRRCAELENEDSKITAELNAEESESQYVN
jgi:hypothetical protein